MWTENPKWPEKHNLKVSDAIEWVYSTTERNKLASELEDKFTLQKTTASLLSQLSHEVDTKHDTNIAEILSNNWEPERSENEIAEIGQFLQEKNELIRSSQNEREKIIASISQWNKASISDWISETKSWVKNFVFESVPEVFWFAKNIFLWIPQAFANPWASIAYIHERADAPIIT